MALDMGSLGVLPTCPNGDDAGHLSSYSYNSIYQWLSLTQKTYQSTINPSQWLTDLTIVCKTIIWPDFPRHYSASLSGDYEFRLFMAHCHISPLTSAHVTSTNCQHFLLQSLVSQLLKRFPPMSFFVLVRPILTSSPVLITIIQSIFFS